MIKNLEQVRACVRKLFHIITSSVFEMQINKSCIVTCQLYHRHATESLIITFLLSKVIKDKQVVVSGNYQFKVTATYHAVKWLFGGKFEGSEGEMTKLFLVYSINFQQKKSYFGIWKCRIDE